MPKYLVISYQLDENGGPVTGDYSPVHAATPQEAIDAFKKRVLLPDGCLVQANQIGGTP